VSLDWALMRQILSLLADNDGLADTEIAERLGAPLADVRQAARILYRQRKLDWSWSYNVLPARARERRRAA
jgi:transcription initiation factor IIE alpha subunit